MGGWLFKVLGAWSKPYQLSYQYVALFMALNGVSSIFNTVLCLPPELKLPGVGPSEINDRQSCFHGFISVRNHQRMPLFYYFAAQRLLAVL